MKNTNNTLFRLGEGAAIVSILLLCACTRESEQDRLYSGTPVNFSASLGFVNGSEATRTAYSGEIYGDYERINWCVNDRFRIASPQAVQASADLHYADYAVTGVTGDTDENSYASISPVGDNGLIWGSGKHSFYAVYPDPDTQDQVSLADRVVTGVIPATQTVTWEGNTGKPDMDLAYMFAATEDVDPQGTVDLFFKPMVTTFQISVYSADDENLTLERFTLSSTDHALCGAFTATVNASTVADNYATDAATFDCPEAAEGNKVITVDLGGKAVPTDRTTPVVFSVFALPQDLTNLSLELVTNAGTRKIALNQNDTPIVFGACHKANIDNLGIPGTWQYTMDDMETIVIDKDDYAIESSVTRAIRARKTATGMADRDVEWKAYFVPTDQTPVIGAAKDDSWSTTPLQDGNGDDWLTLSKYEGTGVAENVTFTIAENPLPPRTVSGGEAGLAAIAQLRNTNLGTVDLSTYDILTRTQGPAETANCYIVHGYGTFLIPLVYGNAVKNGVAVSEPYQRTTPVSYSSTNKDTPQLNTFVNADNNPIGSSFILEDPNLAKSGNYKGMIMWQDVIEGFEILHEEDIQVSTSAPSGAALSCAYMRFTVREENIKPGNIVVALYDEGLQKVLWSWHIWVTAENLSTVEIENASLTKVPLLSSFIGSTPPLRYSGQENALRTQTVVFVAKENNLVLKTLPVEQEQFVVDPENNNERYAAPYFQWGRKDPFLSSAGHISTVIGGGNENQTERNQVKTVCSDYFEIRRPGYDSQGVIYREHIFNSSDEGSGFPTGLKIPSNQYNEGIFKGIIGYGIRHPEMYISSANIDYGIRYQNLWSVNFTWGGTQIHGTKSVYDPSPRGFAVPSRHAFTGWTGAGSDYHATTVDASGEQNRGVWLPTQFRGYGIIGEGVFIPADAYRAHNTSNTWYASEIISFWTADRSSAEVVNQTQDGSVAHEFDSILMVASYANPNSPIHYSKTHRCMGAPVRPVLETSGSADLGGVTSGQSVANHDMSSGTWN